MVTDDVPTYATLAGCFRPVEEYVRLVEATGPLPARVRLTALDAYLMHQFAAYQPSPPAVIDLAGAATGGASTVFWWSDSAIAKLIPADLGRPAGGDDWRRLAAAGGERLGLDPAKPGPADWASAGASDLGRLVRLAPPLCPLLVSVAVGEEDAGGTGELLGRTFETFGNPIVIVWPAGRVGASAVLDECLTACRGGGLRLALPRELSPFLGASRLAVVGRAADDRVRNALDRIGSAFDGNFRFLDAVRDSVGSAAKFAALEKQLVEASAARTARPRIDYPALVRRVRKAVAATLPANCHVAVVSKGDDGLLRLGDRTASHFPQTPDGTYAGHHPADSEAAITHLEEVRDAGADYLLFPATALWWLDHYTDLKEYLALKYTEVYRGDDTAAIFALSPAAKTQAVEHRCLVLAEELQRLRGESLASSLDPRSAGRAVLLPSTNGAENGSERD